MNSIISSFFVTLYPYLLSIFEATLTTKFGGTTIIRAQQFDKVKESNTNVHVSIFFQFNVSKCLFTFYHRALKESEDEDLQLAGSNNKDWAHGRKHVFLSEGARQQLERMRESRRQTSAVKIQSLWRGWHARGGLESCKRTSARAPPPPPALLHHPAMMQFDQSTKRVVAQRPRPQPISGTPPPMIVDNQLMHVDRCDFKTIQQTCSLFGLDLVSILHFFLVPIRPCDL